MDDWQLLNDYATRNSEEAFRALVERYAGMVYHTALRQLGNPHSAEEVAQAVFIILAQKAATIRRQTTLYGWLFRATRFAVLNQRRQEKNRARREQEAYAMQSASNSDDLNPVWEQITPHLDDALDKLPVMDRELVMIRYFGNKSHKEAAQTLGVSEDVVRKRLSRAMEKLRVIFIRRGVAVSSLALVTAFTAHGVQAAPLGLASSLAGVAFAKGATASGLTLTLIKGALKIMAWTQAKTAIMAGVVVLLVAGTTTITVKEIQEHRTYPWQVREFDAKVLDQAPPQVRLLAVKDIPFGGWGTSHGKIMGIRLPALFVVTAAYGFNYPYSRTVLPAELPGGSYDFIASLPEGNVAALQQEVKQKFGVVAKRETRETDVWLLTVKSSNASGLKASVTPGGGELLVGDGQLTVVNLPLSTLVQYLETYFEMPVLDRTGLQGSFDFKLKWDLPKERHHNPDSDPLKEALLDQLGLELVPSNMPIEMLVVEKVK
jgi:uncharacterized protein (TIGR03435 family)